jgi:AraC family transcriptional regulator
MAAAANEVDLDTTVRQLAAGTGWRVREIVCRCGPSDAPFEESHDFVSVSLVLAGTFVYRSTHGRTLMTRGSLLLGNQGACFCCSHEHGTGDHCLAFQFAPSTIDSVARDLHGSCGSEFKRHRMPPHDRLAPLLADARALLTGADPVLAEETALRIAGAALRSAHGVDEAPSRLLDEVRAAAAVRLIETCYAEPLSLAAMAETAGLGRYHFLRVFRRIVGTTPYAYLLNVRLAAAADALRDGMAVLDASIASGFGDLSEFTRRFGMRFGQSAGAFRRANASVQPTLSGGF